MTAFPEPFNTPDPTDHRGHVHDWARCISGYNAAITLGWTQHQRFWRDQLETHHTAAFAAWKERARQ